MRIREDERIGITRIEWDPFTEADQVRELIDRLYAEGARVDVHLIWNASFHEPSYRPSLWVGPGVKKPLSKRELLSKLYRAGRQWVRAFELSRRH